MSEIEVKHLSKTFEQKGVHVDALKDINLTIGAGDIYGIIGMSGAGKSTLVRCLNFLERPTDGQVLIEGKDLGTLNEKELRKQRSDIAMIFQHFNLLMQKNVIDMRKKRRLIRHSSPVDRSSVLPSQEHLHPTRKYFSVTRRPVHLTHRRLLLSWNF